MRDIKEEVERANSLAVERMVEAEPFLIEVKEARYAITQLKDGVLTHAGPPITWGRVSGPLKGALIGAVLLEGWASEPREAERLLAKGEVELKPNNELGAVGPMAGVISPSMRVFVVKDAKSGRVAYSNINEGLGRTLRYGVYSDDVIERLRYLNGEFADALANALSVIHREKFGINLKNIMAQALHMGDELHNRLFAATSLFFREITPYIIEANDKTVASKALRFIDSNNHFFLNLAMAACKCMADAARNIEYSTVVVCIARNGTDVGLQVSGTGDAWFTAPAPTPRGLYFPGFSASDASPDIGDSTITETVGLGGCAMAASPAIVRFVGGSASSAIE